MSEAANIDEQEIIEHGQLIRLKRLFEAAFRVWELKQQRREETEESK